MFLKRVETYREFNCTLSQGCRLVEGVDVMAFRSAFIFSTESSWYIQFKCYFYYENPATNYPETKILIFFVFLFVLVLFVFVAFAQIASFKLQTFHKV